jgi:hypothetical protein
VVLGVYDSAKNISFSVVEKLDSEGEAQWMELFQKCFKVSEHNAQLIYRKYQLNEFLMCKVIQKGKLVAVYSGIFCQNNNLSLFMSTDTMSDGTVSNASIKAAKVLYKHLKQQGVDIVFGYPNENIRVIRERRLNWRYVKSLDFYITVSFFASKQLKSSDIKINRPIHGFFREKPIFCLLQNYKSKFWSFIQIELSDVHLGVPYLNLSKLIGIGRKKMYFLVLNEQLTQSQISAFKQCRLNSSSIDVP